jgi:hypothetical protein
MVVKWYMIFSIWIFLASVLYGLRLSPMNTFPLLVLASIVGTLHFLYRFSEDPWWRLIGIVLIHAIPFLWIRPNLSSITLYQNMGFMVLYIIVMAISGTSIMGVYQTLFTKPPKPFLDAIKDVIL